MKIDIIQENFTNIKILTYKDFLESEIFSQLTDNTLLCDFGSLVYLFDIISFLNRSKIKNTCYLIDNRITIDMSDSISVSRSPNTHKFLYGEIVYIKCENITDIESMKKYLVKFKLSGGDDEV